MPEITYNDRGIPILTVTPKGVSDIIPSIVSEAEAAEIPTKPLVDFDVDAAIRDGASTQEIAQFVSKKANFDYNAAIKDGVTDGEIIQFITGRGIPQISPEIPQEKPQEPTLYQRLEQALSPSYEYINQPLWQKILQAPRGAVETALTFATGIPAFIGGVGVRSIAALADIDKAEELKNKIEQTFTYQPETPIGQYAAQIMAAPFTAGIMGAEHMGGYPGRVLAETVGAALPLKPVLARTGIPLPGRAENKWAGAQPISPEIKTSKPLPSGWTEEGAKAYKITKEKGLPVSPKNIRPTIAGRIIDDLISNTPLVNRMTYSFRKKIVDFVDNEINTIRNKYASPEAIEALDAQIDILYNQAFENIKAEKVPIKNVIDYLKKLEEKNALTKQGKGILADIELMADETGAIPTERLPLLKRQLSTIVKGDMKRTLNQKLLEAISDVEGGDIASEALRQMDKQYMYQQKSKRINALIANSIDNDGYFNPNKFLSQYSKIRDQLKRQVPEIVKDLDALADVIDVAKDDINAWIKYDKQSILQGAGGVAAGAGALWAKPEASIPIGAGLTMLSRSAMSPSGWMRKMLLRGGERAVEQYGLGKKPPILKEEIGPFEPTVQSEDIIPFEMEKTPLIEQQRTFDVASLPKEFQNKPYTGLRPGTPEWMDVWRKHPHLQEEMLSYAKTIGGLTGFALLWDSLSDDDKSRLFPVAFGSLLLRTPFPVEKANILTSINKVKSHPDYLMAKSGIWKSALNLARAIFNPEKVDNLIRENPDAILIPVTGKEIQGTNMIPRAIANVIANHYGLKIDPNVVSTTKVSHKQLSGVGRLISPKIFTGKIEPGRKYILIDDFLTQGGTINELRAYIEGLGGEVVGVIAAGQSKGGNILRPQTAKLLIDKFGRQDLEDFIKKENIAEKIEALTEGQARAILRFNSIDALRNRIAQERGQAGGITALADWQKAFSTVNPDYPTPRKGIIAYHGTVEAGYKVRNPFELSGPWYFSEDPQTAKHYFGGKRKNTFIYEVKIDPETKLFPINTKRTDIYLRDLVAQLKDIATPEQIIEIWNYARERFANENPLGGTEQHKFPAKALDYLEILRQLDNDYIAGKITSQQYDTRVAEIAGQMGIQIRPVSVDVMLFLSRLEGPVKTWHLFGRAGEKSPLQKLLQEHGYDGATYLDAATKKQENRPTRSYVLFRRSGFTPMATSSYSGGN